MKPGIAWTDYSRTPPPWMGTPMTQDKVLLPGGAFVEPTAFEFEDTVVVTVGAAGAAIDAIEIPVSFSHPIPGMAIPPDVVLPSGTVLDFGGDKYATLTTEVTPTVDTTLTVRALVTALVENDVATYAGGRLNRRQIPDGLLLGRTYAEREAGVGFGPADLTIPDEQLFLLAFPITDATEDNFAELYLHGNTVYEEQLPGWNTLDAATQAKIRELYVCIKR
jgi:hypothetical protein